MDEEGDKFPVGLKVLVVDDNPACLKILERLLRSCNFIVTVTNEAVRALQMLRENKDKYDIVISDVHMPDMDGFRLLELIGLELDLPVIMLSANDDPKLVMKGVMHGAVDYLLKPVRVQDLKNIWQHVVRKNRQKGKAVSDSEAGDDGPDVLLVDGNGNLEQEETVTRKRKELSTPEDEGGDGDQEDAATQKKPRIQWNAELHKIFVDAYNQLGPDKAFPKKILEIMRSMGVDWLTRENVASHLQKYRLYLRRVGATSSQSSDASFVIPLCHYDSSIYPNRRSLQAPYNVHCSLNSGLGKSSVATTPSTSCQAGFRSSMSHCHSGLGRFMVPKQNMEVPGPMSMGQFRHQNSNKAMNHGLIAAAPSASVVHTLMDYNKRMEKWQAGIGSLYTPQNDPLTPFDTFHVGSTVELQALALQNGSIKISNASNNPLVPAIDSSCQSFADSSFGVPSLMQSAQVHDSDDDALMRFDDHYLLEDTELLAELIQENSGTLDDIVNGFLLK